jgi:hypothetical protein
VVVAVNGPFGVGKTTACTALAARLPDVLVYDPEAVGTLVRSQLPYLRGDYQDRPSWRALVPATAAALALDHGGPIVMPMSVLRRTYLEEILQRLDQHGFAARHVLLHAEHDTVIRRITTDGAFDDDPAMAARIREWRTGKLADYTIAVPWLLGFGDLVDTTALTTHQVADHLQVLTCGRPPDGHRT